MTLFREATNDQAYLKMGILGFAGGGKTTTASYTAIGLWKMLKKAEETKPEDKRLNPKPVFFLDTETGASAAKVDFDKAGVPLYTAKTRAFVDLLTAVKEAEKNSSVLIVDSITHFWIELTKSFMKKKNRTRLLIQDWPALREEWAKYTEAFLNSSLHIIMCGRAGFEYDTFEDEDGKKQMEKSGVKMKADSETGYEPSLLVYMEREMDMETKTVHRIAHILKDRYKEIDGKSLRDPKFESFLPHIKYLNIGGVHIGVDTTRNSESLIGADMRTDYEREKLEKGVVLDEIEAAITRRYPGRGAEEQTIKKDLLQKHFGSMSWERIKTFDLKSLKDGYKDLFHELFPQEEKKEVPVKAEEPLEKPKEEEKKIAADIF